MTKGLGDLGPYPAYEDSGLPWLGKVPERWKVHRGKAIFQCIDSRSTTGKEELLTVSSSRGVVPRSTANVTMFKAESYTGYKLCWPGDLVINSLWAWAGGLGVSRHHGIVSSAYGVYRLCPAYRDYSSFIHELVRSQPFNWELKVRSKGIWISRLQLTDESFLSAPFSLPPPEEQTAIVRFLDHSDRQIRRYIRVKQKLIKLLEEQKQAIIHRVVTRGLDPNVRLKPSGVAWLGEVPEHWEVMALRRRWSVTDCKHLTVPFVTEGIPLASVRETQSFELDFKTSNHTTDEWYGKLIEGGREPRKGDLIYCRNVSVGAAALVTCDKRFAMGQDVCLIKSFSESQRWLNYFLHSRVMASQLAVLQVGSTFSRINVSDIKGLLIAVPPRSEQERIAAFLDEEFSKVDVAIGRCRQEIALLSEYRTRLIADVVTGKLDVREVATRLPVDIEEPDPVDDAGAVYEATEGEAEDLDATPEEADA